MGLGSAVGWIVTIATTRRQLLDHLKECNQRHADSAARQVRIEDKLDKLIDKFVKVR